MGNAVRQRVITGTFCAAFAVASTGRAVAGSCESLATLQLPHTTMTLATVGQRTNLQAVTVEPTSGPETWTSEHGPRGGDEINVVEKGKNYGFPVIGYGREYTATCSWRSSRAGASRGSCSKEIA